MKVLNRFLVPTLRHGMFIFVLLICLSSMAMAGVITPQLQQLLDTTDDDTYVWISIELVEQADIETLDRQLTREHATFADRHYQVISTLQEVANRTQPELIAFLEMEAETGAVQNINPLWITNSIEVEAKKDAIQRIANHPLTAFIYKVTELHLIEPVEREIDPSPPTPGGTEIGLRSIRATEVWHRLGINGEGTLVSNLDTGVDGNHPAIASRWRGNFAPWQECWKAASGSFPTDENGHGTHTMGTMCGADTAVAIQDTVGVAPAALWIAADVLGENGVSGGSALQWIADPDGNPNTHDDVPDACNNSWGRSMGGGSPCLGSGDLYPGMDACEAAGVVVLWSAGNEGPGSRTIGSPADRAQTPYSAFAIGATNASYPFTIADFSSRGPSDCPPGSHPYPTKPEVSAPGVNIRSCTPNEQYERMSGTSMSCPHTSGVVALMRQANPNMEVNGANGIKQALMNSCIDLGEEGEDNTYGWGFIDAFVAVGRYAMQLPYLELVMVNIDDSQGNNNGRPDPGETVELTVSLINVWDGEAVDPIAELTTDYEELTFDTNIVTYPNIAGDAIEENIDDPFIFTVDEDAEGATVQFMMTVTTQDNPMPYELPFEIVIGRPEVLLVDDDNGSEYEVYYRAAMDTAGINYEVWNVALNGVPTNEQLVHDIVVWYTGDSDLPTLDEDEQAFLETYLDDGGNLFITGQDIGRDLVIDGNGPEFYHDYLRAELIEEDRAGLVILSGIEGDCLSEDWDLIVAMGQVGPNNQDSPSVIAPAEGLDAVETIYYRASEDAGGIKYWGDYNLVYYSFGFEAIYETPAGSVAPHEMMDSIIEWLRDPCDAGGGGDTYSISGTLPYGDWDLNVSNAELNLTGDDNQTTMSDQDGNYQFDDISEGDYTLTPAKENDINGISAFDAARVAQYSAGVYDLSEYQLIAADVTGNGDVSPFDAARIAQYAAGVPHGSLCATWTFIPTERTYQPLNENMSDEDFVGILYGEVTGNWSPASMPMGKVSNNNVAAIDATLEVGTIQGQPGTEVVVPVKLHNQSGNDVFAAQFVVDYNIAELTFVKANANDDIQLYVNNTNNGLTVALYSVTPITGDLCQLTFKTSEDCQVAQGLNLREALVNENSPAIKGGSVNVAVTPSQYHLAQNTPNPFNPMTTISFEIPSVNMVTLNVYDVSGKLVKTLVDSEIGAGHHAVVWDGTDQNGVGVNSGVYFYRLETENYTNMKRMILLK